MVDQLVEGLAFSFASLDESSYLWILLNLFGNPGHELKPIPFLIALLMRMDSGRLNKGSGEDSNDKNLLKDILNKL